MHVATLTEVQSGKSNDQRSRPIWYVRATCLLLVSRKKVRLTRIRQVVSCPDADENLSYLCNKACKNFEQPPPVDLNALHRTLRHESHLSSPSTGFAY